MLKDTSFAVSCVHATLLKHLRHDVHICHDVSSCFKMGWWKVSYSTIINSHKWYIDILTETECAAIFSGELVLFFQNGNCASLDILKPLRTSFESIKINKSKYEIIISSVLTKSS